MNKKLMFIVNPIAGRMLAKEHMLKIINRFDEVGYHVTVCCTQKNKNATEIVLSRGAEFDLIVCCGGDGTLKETTDGVALLPGRPTIGYIPMGTTNDFARTLNIPTDTMEAVEAIIEGNEVESDLGKFNNNSEFIYVAAFGALSETSYMATQKMKNRIGRGAYYWESVKRLKDIKAIKLKATFDDEEIEGDFIYGSISNSYAIAGFNVLTNAGVQLDDGFHELVLIRYPKNPAQFVSILNSIINKTPCENEHIIIRHIKDVNIIFEKEIPWSLDGEFGGAFTEVNIKCVQNGLKLFAKSKDNKTEDITDEEKIVK